MNIVYLSLGSNEGDKGRLLNLAIAAIESRCGRIMLRSAIYETAAWGLEQQPDFLNVVLKVSTRLHPKGLLKEIQVIESELGRQRTVKWGQRTIDIDILLFNNELINDEHLTIPHPFLHLRRFILEPLNEIGPELVHPLLRLTVAKLLKDCPDPLKVHKSAGSPENP